MEKVTIIVPAYNVKNYVKLCIKSILNQTYPNVELILVNDGSTDGTGNILDEYSYKYSNIKVIHKSNGGVSSARNEALRVATGKYIGFVDSDDWIEPDMFELLVAAMEQCDAQLVSCDLFYDVSETNYHTVCNFENRANQNQVVGVKNPYKEILVTSQVSGYLCNKLFRKELVAGLLLDEEIAQNEDLLFITQYLSSVTKMVHVSKKLYHYRMGNVAPSITFNARSLTLMTAYEKILDCYRKQAPEFVWLPEKNLLKIFLNFKGRLKILNIKDLTLWKRVQEGVKTHLKSVLLSTKVTIGEKINIILTLFFPETMLRIKIGILTKRHMNGNWEE